MNPRVSRPVALRPPPPPHLRKPFLLSERSLIQLTVVLFLLGLAYLVSSCSKLSDFSSATSLQAPIRLRITGQIVVPAGGDLTKVGCHLRFAQVPLDIFHLGGDGWLDSAGKFSLEATVAATQIPGSFSLQAEAPGLVAAVTDQALTPNNGDRIADVGSFTLAPTAPATPLHPSPPVSLGTRRNFTMAARPPKKQRP